MSLSSGVLFLTANASAAVIIATSFSLRLAINSYTSTTGLSIHSVLSKSSFVGGMNSGIRSPNANATSFGVSSDSSFAIEVTSVEFGVVFAESLGEHPMKVIRLAAQETQKRRSAIVIVEETSKKYSKR